MPMQSNKAQSAMSPPPSFSGAYRGLQEADIKDYLWAKINFSIEMKIF